MRLFTRILLLLLCVLFLHGQPGAPKRTALDDYVAAPDSNYKYELLKTVTGTDFTAYALELTSQRWLTEREVDSPLWKHWLTIIKPSKAREGTGLLWINGGSNTGNSPPNVDSNLWMVAMGTNSVVADLRMVPNQPIVFTADPEKKSRTEDSLIAFGEMQFLKTGDPKWIVRLPMTKSAVRAMDAVTSFLASERGGRFQLARFMVAGGSKRGWTTWTTAAVDPRVIAIGPAVIDVLHFQPSMVHHWRSYGFWAPAIGDYAEILTNERTNPRLRENTIIEDPYEYRDRLTMPKCIVNSAGDQYFLPDSSQFYFNDLKGEKYLRYVPNSDHSLKKSDAYQGLAAFYLSIIEGTPRPRFSWVFEANGSIRVKTVDKPTEVKLWAAHNPEHRDFRLETLGPAYQATMLQPDAKGEYVATVAKPESGWTAYFVELTFPGSRFPFKFTTEVRITPNTLPFPAPK
jgi:PhoPQ-activated pathogenicity-related protein